MDARTRCCRPRAVSLGAVASVRLDRAGDERRPAGSLLSYNLPQGWSLYSNATITSNWTKEHSERWTVPVGGGVGKLTISVSLQGFYNVVTPNGGPDWSMNFQLALLFAAPQ